jgi:predicted flap endonuclease-1-like 5' DNA nuclease
MGQERFSLVHSSRAHGTVASIAIGPSRVRDYNVEMRDGGEVCAAGGASDPSPTPSAPAGFRRVLTFAVLAAIAAALGLGYATGRSRRGADRPPPASPAARPPADRVVSPPAPLPLDSTAASGENEERARLIRSYEAEAHALRCALAGRDAAPRHRDFVTERQDLGDELAKARADTARYRQLVLDIESNAPPPLFGTGAPDDLKLIVGIGPVLERMLHQLGVATYRQIAHWSERDIEAFDARLPEFPGRIRRDGWVAQARELHMSKFGERP